jgi:hypothetical protein
MFLLSVESLPSRVYQRLGVSTAKRTASLLYTIQLVETLIHTVKPDDIATFMGQNPDANFQGEMGNRFNVRVLGTRLKYMMEPVVLKVYDKFGLILRIETTVNDVSFFKQHRQAQHRDDETESRNAPMKKTHYSLAPLAEQLHAANRRYLAFLSVVATSEVGIARLRRLSESCLANDHRYRGFNLSEEADTAILRLMVHVELAISGLTTRAVNVLLPDQITGESRRLLKRVRVRGLLKKFGQHYKY